ncbi:MAG: DUF2752 domain-containing protein [Actinobacteria bacterium]|nr:DUF2752 domain-containing protein [Actinomycetota bacterium]
MNSSFARKVIANRAGRIGLVAIAWLLVREASLRTSGFNDGPILCPWRLLTGYPCPGCGGIRAMSAISIGQFEQAWLLNPIAFLVCCVVLIWAIRITPMIEFAQKTSVMLRSQSLSLQIIVLITVYSLAWIAAIVRFNSGIL